MAEVLVAGQLETRRSTDGQIAEGQSEKRPISSETTSLVQYPQHKKSQWPCNITCWLSGQSVYGHMLSFYVFKAFWIVQNTHQRAKMFMLVQMVLQGCRRQHFECHITPQWLVSTLALNFCDAPICLKEMWPGPIYFVLARMDQSGGQNPRFYKMALP